MEPIYPLSEENLNQFTGQLVCVVMQDGTRHVGVLSRCGKGRLLLNDGAAEEGALELEQAETGSKKSAGKRGSRRKNNGKSTSSHQPGEAYTAAYPFGGLAGGYPYAPQYPGFFGPRVWLDLALIALVLLII